MDALINFLTTYLAIILGTVTTSLILGFMLDRFIIKKIFRNEKVQRLQKQIDKILDKLDELTEKT